MAQMLTMINFSHPAENIVKTIHVGILRAICIRSTQRNVRVNGRKKAET